MSPSIATLPVLVGLAVLPQDDETKILFTIDWKGPTISVLDSGGGTPITEADILTPGTGVPEFGPLPPPSIEVRGDALGLSNYAACIGHPPGTPCGVEVDSLSQGLDALLQNGALPGGQRLWFSVDEWAVGDPSLTTGPTVFTEGGVNDAAADAFVEYGLPAGPLPPSPSPGTHVGTLDGNGLPSAPPSGLVYRGIGLIEPTIPGTPPPNTGDNLDSLDLTTAVGFPPLGYFFSLDAAFVDPKTNLPNSGSAGIQGFSGADVLRTATPAGTPTLYASAQQLGLNLVGPDDIDAMVLSENGDGIFQVSQQPYDWVGGGKDMLLFSVRRGSAVIGQLDSIFGVPIEEGDILTAPLPTSMGGLSLNPGIFYAAENLGLSTSRTHGEAHGDDVDALDITTQPYFDCNHNGVEDSVDIATGGSSDTNNNGVPDECEAITEYCYCGVGDAPCANPDPEVDGGCANSTGQGGHLYFNGTQSVSADDLVLISDKLPTSQFGLYFMGGGGNLLTFGDGLRCAVGGGVGVFRFTVTNTGALGMATRGPGIVATAAANFPPAGWITAGSSWFFQFWHRDPPGPCGSGWNTTNGLRVDFGP